MAIPSYLIVGAGVFGTSTALHLIRKYPQASITLLDRNALDAETRVAASWDWNKVVRADYDDIAYMKLALEARDVWKSDPLWQPFYHEIGVLWASRSSFASQVVDNYAALGVKADLAAVPVDDVRKEYGGLFADADYTGISEVLVNKTSGLADAKDALRRVGEEAVALGVRFIQAEVEALELDHDDGGCRGVKTKDGNVILADRVVLCTGAFTPKLLMDTAPGRTALHAGERIVAAAVAEGVAPLSDVQLEKYKDMPVFVDWNPVGRGADSGCLKYDRGKLLKFWGQHVITNGTTHPVTSEYISTPPQGTDYKQWDVPNGLKEDIRIANEVTFGKNAFDLKFEQYRICWEALTPSEDFIVSPHPACGNLYIATCGSFHGFKFFPILGKYVVQLLDGQLDSSLQKKWAWDRDLPSTVGNPQWPRKQLKDFI